MQPGPLCRTTTPFVSQQFSALRPVLHLGPRSQCRISSLFLHSLLGLNSQITPLLNECPSPPPHVHPTFSLTASLDNTCLRIGSPLSMANLSEDLNYYIIPWYRNIVHMQAGGNHCLLSTRGEEARQFILILCNAIGSPVDSKYISLEPQLLAVTATHAIAASPDAVFVWQHTTGEHSTAHRPYFGVNCYSLFCFGLLCSQVCPVSTKRIAGRSSSCSPLCFIPCLIPSTIHLYFIFDRIVSQI